MNLSGTSSLLALKNRMALARNSATVLTVKRPVWSYASRRTPCGSSQTMVLITFMGLNSSRPTGLIPEHLRRRRQLDPLCPHLPEPTERRFQLLDCSVDVLCSGQRQRFVAGQRQRDLLCLPIAVRRGFP